MSKKVSIPAKGCRRQSSRLCAWCTRCLVRNTETGNDTKFDPPCSARVKIRGVILLDGNRSKLMERISRLIDDATSSNPNPKS